MTLSAWTPTADRWRCGIALRVVTGSFCEKQSGEREKVNSGCIGEYQGMGSGFYKRSAGKCVCGGR